MQILTNYSINYLDIALAVPLAYGIYKGFKKGLILELTSLLALIIGLFGGIYFFDIGKDFLERHFEISAQFLPILSFVILFISIVLVINLAGKILDQFVKMIALGGINRLIGAAFGLLKMAIIMSAILMFTYKLHSFIPLLSQENTQNSVLYRPLRFLVPGILPQLDSFDGWDDFIQEGKDLLLDHVPEEAPSDTTSEI